MSSLANEQAALAKDQGKLMKLLKVLKKLVAKEFLIILLALVLALPLAFIYMLLLEVLDIKGLKAQLIAFFDGAPLFLGAYLFAIFTLYFIRSIVSAILTLVKKES